MPYLLIGKHDIVEMALQILSSNSSPQIYQWTYSLKLANHKILTSLFVETDKLMLIVCGNAKDRIVKTILKKENKFGRVTLSYFRL